VAQHKIPVKPVVGKNSRHFRFYRKYRLLK
jgi:hypothetical protein